MTTDRRVLLKRSTADRYVREIVERIREVNSDARFCYRVERAVLFGSYVNSPGRDRIGDLDVALDLQPKYDGPLREEMEQQSRLRGPGGMSDFQWLIWPREEVLKHIKARRGYISLHNIRTDEEAVFSGEWRELDISA